MFLLVFIVGLLMTLPMFAFAQDMSDFQNLMAVFTAVKAGGLGAILAAVFQLLKSPWLGGLIGKFDKRVHPVLMLILGAAVSTVEKIATGQPWYLGLVEGSIIGTVAMGIYDTIKIPAKLSK